MSSVTFTHSRSATPFSASPSPSSRFAEPDLFAFGISRRRIVEKPNIRISGLRELRDVAQKIRGKASRSGKRDWELNRFIDISRELEERYFHVLYAYSIGATIVSIVINILTKDCGIVSSFVLASRSLDAIQNYRQ